MKIRSVLLGLVVSASAVSQASATTTDDTVTAIQPGPYTVNNIQTGNTTSTLAQFKDASGNLVSCGASQFFQIAKARTTHDNLYKSLMASYLSGKPVTTVYYELISNVCWIKAVGNS